MVKKNGGDMTGGQLKADKYVFDKSKNKEQKDEQTEEVQKVSDAEMRAMWLRKVQTRPADFLRAKFAYQYAMKDQKK